MGTRARSSLFSRGARGEQGCKSSRGPLLQRVVSICKGLCRTFVFHGNRGVNKLDNKRGVVCVPLMSVLFIN